MNKKIKLCYCNITIDSDILLSATQLRSYIGYKFAQDTEFHHHDDNPYRYPLIQYKRIDNQLLVLGIDRFADVVKKQVPTLQQICLKSTKIPISNIIISQTTHVMADDITQYRFCSPWLALNQENNVKFHSLDGQFHKKLLEKILTGNLLTMTRGLDYKVDYDLYVKINRFSRVPVIAHENNFLGFYCSFLTNLSIPQYVGVGKSVSKGFGILERIVDS